MKEYYQNRSEVSEMEEIKRVLVSDPLSNKGLEILGKAKNLKYDIKPGLSPEELKKNHPGI